jgi:Flp pilus assembly protein TadG
VVLVRRDGGQATPLFALVVVMALLAALLVARIGGVVVEQARARNAADAAALAGVAGGRASAERLAGDNHGHLEQFVTDGHQVEVTVRVGDARATARARPTAPQRN